jgi:hypothetical protein
LEVTDLGKSAVTVFTKTAPSFSLKYSPFHSLIAKTPPTALPATSKKINEVNIEQTNMLARIKRVPATGPRLVTA